MGTEGSTVARGRQNYSSLPNVHLAVEGGFSGQPHNVSDLLDDTKRSHSEQEFTWSIDEEHQELVIRITRKPEAARVNVAVKIEGGLLEQRDGNVVSDGNDGRNGVSTFGLTFKISDVRQSGNQPNPQQTHQIAESGEAYRDPNSQQARTQDQAYLHPNYQHAGAQDAPLYSQEWYDLMQTRIQLLSLQNSLSNRTFMSYFDAHNDTCSVKYQCDPCGCSACKRSRLCSEDSGCHCSQCTRFRLYSG